MLALSFGVLVFLRTVAPALDGNTSLGIGLVAFFVLDVAYRIFVARKQVKTLKAKTASGEIKPVRRDLIEAIPTPIGTAFTGKGGMLMLLPCWLCAILLGCVIFLL